MVQVVREAEERGKGSKKGERGEESSVGVGKPLLDV